MPNGVPTTNHSSYSRHKINISLATTYDCSIEWRPSVRATTRILTSVTLVNPTHNSRNARVNPPSQVKTEGIPFRAITQEMLQQRSSSRYHQSLVDHAHPNHKSPCPCIIVWRCSKAAQLKSVADRLTELLFRQAPTPLNALPLGIA